MADSEAERSEAQESASVRRGRPGRRSAEERRQAVLELLSGKATVDQLGVRFGVKPETIESWREVALDGIGEAQRQGTGKSARERELEKKLRSLERAFTDLAIRNELAERALTERPTRRGKSPRSAARPLGEKPRCCSSVAPLGSRGEPTTQPGNRVRSVRLPSPGNGENAAAPGPRLPSWKQASDAWWTTTQRGARARCGLGCEETA